MKLFAFVLFVASLTVHAYGQGDSTVYRMGLPVSEDDTARNFPSYNFSPENNVVIIPHSNLPVPLRESLAADAIYEGWEKSPVRYNRETKIYTISVTRDSVTTEFGLTEQGKPVTYGKEDSVEDQ